MKFVKAFGAGAIVMAVTLIISLVAMVKVFPLYISPVVVDGNDPASYIWINEIRPISITRNSRYKMTEMKEDGMMVIELQNNAAYSEPVLISSVDTSVLGESADPKLVMAVIAGSKDSDTSNSVTYIEAAKYDYSDLGYFLPYSNANNFNTAKKVSLAISLVLGCMATLLVIVLEKKKA